MHYSRSRSRANILIRCQQPVTELPDVGNIHDAFERVCQQGLVLPQRLRMPDQTYRASYNGHPTPSRNSCLRVSFAA